MNHRLKRIRTFLCCLFHVKGYSWYAPWMYDQLRRLNGMEEEMENAEIVIWLQSLKSEIGKQSNQHLWNYEEALDMAIKALEKDEWTPISDGLPETMGKYFVTVLSNPSKNPISTTAFYSEFRNGFGTYRVNGSWKKHDVVASMPLPEPYREDGEA